jgi:transposase
MPRGTTLSQEEIGMIKAFKAIKLSNREIARKIGRSSWVINNFVKKPSEYNTKHRSGRTSKLNSRQKRQIFRLASNRSISSKQIVHQLSLPVSKWTVNRAINRSGFLKYAKKQHSPALTERHKANRLKWAQTHMTWNQEWDKIVWSDEKKFNLDGPDGLHYYWHDIRKEKMFSVRRGMGGGGVMIWAAFGHFGKSDLSFITTKLNANGYRELLEEHLDDISQKFGDSEWTFQQDNAPIHRAKANFPWFRSKNINLLEWPALSPDLNPLENVWGILARRVYAEGRQFSDVEELKRAIVGVWNEISLEDLRKHSDSMPNRIFEVIKNQGGKTKY